MHRAGTCARAKRSAGQSTMKWRHSAAVERFVPLPTHPLLSRLCILCCLLNLCRLISAEETSDEEWPFFPVIVAYESARAPFYECTHNDLRRIPISVETTYQLDRKMPPGCECRKTGDTDKECTMFECSCICDLTAGMCDHNCCCDEECTSEQRERFEDIEQCQPEGPVAEEITKCYSRKVVDQVNPRFPMTAKGTAKSSLDRMLCVRYDNSDLRGEYFDDPGYPSSSKFDDSNGQKDFDYPSWMTSSLQTYAADQTYDTGDALLAAFRLNGIDGMVSQTSNPDDAHFVFAHGGVLPLPVADDFGECLESQRAEFGSSFSSECLRRIDSVEEDCTSGELGSFRFASRLYVGAHAGVTPASGESSWIEVQVRHVRWRNYANQDEVDFSTFDSTSAVCDAIYDTANYSSGAAPSTQTSSGVDNTTSLLTPTIDCPLPPSTSITRPGAPACRNALVELCYTILYDAEDSRSRIQTVYADLTLTDIPSTVRVLRQRFSIEFQSASQIFRRSEFDANTVDLTRSGNPGYLVGRPVRAGRLSAFGTQEYVWSRIDGLRILGGIGDSVCADDFEDFVVVPFGADSRSGCILRLNRTGLEDFCNGRGPHAAGRALPRYFNVTNSLVFDGDGMLPDDVVGIFGNADPLDTTQWIRIDVKAAAFGETAVWNELEGTCTGAVTSMNYRFLWAYVGAHDNPQAKIIAARVEFEMDDLVYRTDGTNASTQAFSIQASATFKQYSTEYEHYTPPSPPVAISVPYDVWYPFKIESRAVRRRTLGPSLALILASTGLFAIFWYR